MEPGKAGTPTNRGSIELSDGPLRTAAILYLSRRSAAPQEADHLVRYINRLLSANSGPLQISARHVTTGPRLTTTRRTVLRGIGAEDKRDRRTSVATRTRPDAGEYVRNASHLMK